MEIFRPKRIAIIVSGAMLDRSSSILSVALRRCELLQSDRTFLFDFYIMRAEERCFKLKSLLRGEISAYKDSIDGIPFTVLLKIEYFSRNRLIRKILKQYHVWFHRRLCDWEWHKQFSGYFRHYDLLSAHFNDAGILAESVNKRFGIPYCVTWHGSDIHTIPFADEAAKVKTVKTLEHSGCNFFVSRTLLEISDKLTVNAKKEVLYNAADSRFFVFSEDRMNLLRTKYNLCGKKVVAFAGSLIPRKNASILPEIFYRISSIETGEKIVFWIIGDGPLRFVVENKIRDQKLNCHLFGAVSNDLMPELYNCIDVLVLPSKHEGLPLVALEAISCGSIVVGSDVPEVVEAIGSDYSAKVEEGNIDAFVAKVVRCLNLPNKQLLCKDFSWEVTAEKEKVIYHNLLNC